MATFLTGFVDSTDRLFSLAVEVAVKEGAISAGVKRIGVYWWTAHTSVAQAEGDAAYLAQLRGNDAAVAAYRPAEGEAPAKFSEPVTFDLESPAASGLPD